MTEQPSFSKLVIHVLMGADRPLTIDEIIWRVELFRPIDTRDPRSTVRNAIGTHHLATTLGGRPAHYTWWPRHLAENAFRQPLAASDLEAGTLTLTKEVRFALWPDFFAGPSREEGNVTLHMDDGPDLHAQIQHLVAGQAVWGLPPNPALAAWYHTQGAQPEDDLIVRVLDVDDRHYAVHIVRRAGRDETAIAARNQALADAAEVVLRSGRTSMPDFYLIPRLIAQNAYRHPVPPDPWAGVLRADLRFVVGDREANLAEKLVDYLERELAAPPDPFGSPRPRGNRRKARSEEVRQAWGAYLFDRGMDHLWAGWPVPAEAYYREALRIDPGHADAWVHLGNRRFDEGRVAEALAHYERGQAAAEERTIGDPASYTGCFWGDVRSRPFMRALSGRALCLWQIGQRDEARHIFAQMLEINPRDNQGARFLLHDLNEGLSYEESVKRQEDALP